MNRRDFLMSAAAVALLKAIGDTPEFISVQDSRQRLPGEIILPAELAAISEEVKNNFSSLLKWMEDNRWLSWFEEEFGIKLAADNPLAPSLFESFPATTISKAPGFEDFAGTRPIEPGLPAYSLIYHALASPAVKIPGQQSPLRYPSAEQLDLLENYIYALKKISDYQTDTKKLVLAVFAYEYRPGAKTPHHAHADLVFSRTGIARIGSEKLNYDRVNRCYINEPLPGIDPGRIAVTPARYGIFLAEVVKVDDSKIDLMTSEISDEGANEKLRSFLRPVRKIFNGDLLIGNCRIVYSENHLNEKLYRLSQNDEVTVPPAFNVNRVPFKRISCTKLNTSPVAMQQLTGHDSDMVQLDLNGSSVLLSSVPAALVRPAVQGTERLRFKVPQKKRSVISKDIGNRRYTSLKLYKHKIADASDFIITDGFYRGQGFTRFSSPRNTPMFINIRNRVNPDDGSIEYLGNGMNMFEEEITGSYWAALFEDSICDGCVAGGFDGTVNSDQHGIASSIFTNCLPAFSLVTAPDFFPYADCHDMRDMEEYFLEGGPKNLGGGRLRANPAIHVPGANTSAFPCNRKTHPVEYSVSWTITAVLSDKPAGTKRFDALKRTYKATSFLPDNASFVFAPGWDITYSGKKKDVFMATYGLGSPFPEDMKLCAAANGMWPASSPDAARTFQGSLHELPTLKQGKLRPPSAVPLMDSEIGIHPRSPAIQLGATAARGWDGEHGPFFEMHNNHLHVNFTDVGRADYVDNALRNYFDMSLLRNLQASELIFRMDCLKRCIRDIDFKVAAFTQLWLVSAERVDPWRAGIIANGWGVPVNLVGTDNQWAKMPQVNINGPGFLYVFARLKDKESEWVQNDWKRKRHECDKIYVCQVTACCMAWTEVPGNGLTSSNELKWRLV